MRRSTLLLQENPLYVLAPGISLPQNVTVNAEEKNSNEGPHKCDSCGNTLTTPYYVSFGIPPCSLIIETYQILRDGDAEFKELVSETQSLGSLSRENLVKLTSENDKEFKRLVSEIQSAAKMRNIDIKYQWIFSEQNIMSSKTRICNDCQKEYKWRVWRGFETRTMRIHKVYFAIEEYQRCHTPIDTAKSEYERYIISLPNRTNSYWQHFGDADLNEDFWIVDHEERMIDCLSTALIPGYEAPDSLSEEFRANFIQDNKILNDQELTKWMKKCINNDNDDYWYRIQYCKIFVNPKTLKYPRHPRHNGKIIYTTRYTVVVHHSIPKDDWREFDI
jgi:hypothetical protein